MEACATRGAFFSATQSAANIFHLLRGGGIRHLYFYLSFLALEQRLEARFISRDDGFCIFGLCLLLLCGRLAVTQAIPLT